MVFLAIGLLTTKASAFAKATADRLRHEENLKFNHGFHRLHRVNGRFLNAEGAESAGTSALGTSFTDCADLLPRRHPPSLKLRRTGSGTKKYLIADTAGTSLSSEMLDA